MPIESWLFLSLVVLQWLWLWRAERRIRRVLRIAGNAKLDPGEDRAHYLAKLLYAAGSNSHVPMAQVTNELGIAGGFGARTATGPDAFTRAGVEPPHAQEATGTPPPPPEGDRE